MTIAIWLIGRFVGCPPATRSKVRFLQFLDRIPGKRHATAAQIAEAAL
jgi:hypothetical protein